MQPERADHRSILALHPWLVAAACALVTLALAACQPAGAVPGEAPHAPIHTAGVALPAASPADTLKGGCSGGVTGGGNGVAVTGRGEILRWAQATATHSVEFTVVRTDSAAVADLFAEAQRIGFRSIDYRKPFNMTCFLTLTDSAGVHTVAWPAGEVPPAVRELSRQLNALAPRQRLRD